MLMQERINEIKARPIDFSDIPEFTPEEMAEFYPRNWKPKKEPISIRIDKDLLEWLQQPDKKGYQKRLNAVLRWAKQHNCPVKELL